MLIKNSPHLLTTMRKIKRFFFNCQPTAVAIPNSVLLFMKIYLWSEVGKGVWVYKCPRTMKCECDRKLLKNERWIKGRSECNDNGKFSNLINEMKNLNLFSYPSLVITRHDSILAAHFKSYSKAILSSNLVSGQELVYLCPHMMRWESENEIVNVGESMNK